MPVLIGSRLGPYEILAAIGAGGMGKVYRARDMKLGRDVAIKVLLEEFARDAGRMARFQREAKVLASLNHPNIAAIYGLEDSGATHALVMELVEGPTLADRIGGAAREISPTPAGLKLGPTQPSQGQRIPVDEALKIAKQICEALEYAHERGIIHRDLKPANVKVAADDTVKVLDFGLAKAIQGNASETDFANSPTISELATMQGVLLGTAAYMSPEQAKGKQVDRRADIWAFGCVFYEMLTGKVAFRGESVTDTLAAVIKEEPDWSQLPASTPIRVRVLLRRCMQKDVRQRLQAIGDARIALEEVLSGEPDTALDGTRQGAVPMWRRTPPWFIGGVSLAFSLAVFSWFYLQARSSQVSNPGMMRFQILAPENAAFDESGEQAVSPDGRQIAFLAVGSDGLRRVWIRPVDSLEARPLSGSEMDYSVPLFWSPDSRYIAFGNGGKLKKIGISGGPSETICDLPVDVLGGAWNLNGVIVVGQVPGQLMRISADGGAAEPLTVLDSSRSESLHAFPSFLPDGKHFVYLRASTIVGKSGVYLGSLDAKPGEQDSKQLVATEFGPAYVTSSDPAWGYLLFVRDGTLLAQRFDNRRLELSGEPATVADQVGTFRARALFSASSTGVLSYRGSGPTGVQLVWLDRQGKVSAKIGEPGADETAALSADGRALAVTQFTTRSPTPGLWLVNLARGTDREFTLGPAAENPVWSPDGTMIAFDSDRGGVSGLYRKPVSGTKGEELLLTSGQEKAPTSWSRDGRFLLYTSLDPATKGDLWVLPLKNDRKPRILVRTEFNEKDAHFSPDGRWVAYTSDESGRDEIYIRMFTPDSSAAPNTESKWLVSSGGGNSARWSSDEKQLYYVSPDGKLTTVDIAVGPEFQAGGPKDLFRLPSGATFQDVSADGEHFLALAPVQQSNQTPFTVVLNWEAGLKK